MPVDAQPSFFVDNGADIRRPSRFGGVALVLFEDKELRFALSRRALIMLGIGAGASLLAAFSGIGLAKLRGGKGSEGMRRTSSSSASETSRSAELP